MTTAIETYYQNKEITDCVDLFTRLLNARLIKVGQVYDWPIQFQFGFDSGTLLPILQDYAHSGGFDVTVNGSNQFEITAVFP